VHSGSDTVIPKDCDHPLFYWNSARGRGYYPVAGEDYGTAYFDKYAAMAATDMGRQLTAARVDMVAQHWRGELVDIGIGCGQFVQARPNTLGYDVNPAGVAWLRDRSLFLDIYGGHYPAATFWDSLEHIDDMARILNCIRHWAFVSIPIFTSRAHALRSRHFRPDEHFHYFTERGFRLFMKGEGWHCEEMSEFESDAGREDILSFAFRRA